MIAFIPKPKKTVPPGVNSSLKKKAGYYAGPWYSDVIFLMHLYRGIRIPVDIIVMIIQAIVCR